MCTQQARIVKFLLKEIFDNLCVDSEANDNTQSGPDLVGARHARPRKSMILNVSVSNVRTKGDMRRSVMTRTRDFLHWRWKLCRIHFLSLFYNDHLNGDYVFDTVMQPAFWFVDHCTAAVGPVFVAVVMFLTVRAVVRRNGQIGDERLTEPTSQCFHYLCALSVYNHKALYQNVFNAFFTSILLCSLPLCSLPTGWGYRTMWKKEAGPCFTVSEVDYIQCNINSRFPALVLLGHYLLINVIFHFFRAWLTSPGHPPTNQELERVTTICKKCIAPKPPRTHHCSVCNACVLKMDHHCPWLNNCVGHFNHRHFFLYMVFTVTGCAFIMMFGFEIFMEEFADHWWGGAGDVQLATRYPGQSFGVFTRRSLVFYEAFMTSATFVALGGLAAWHARLITAGQTSIEAHINRSETKRLAEQGKLYRNPYNFGPLHNWFLFLGEHQS